MNHIYDQYTGPVSFDNSRLLDMKGDQMFRIISLSVVWLVLVSVNADGADKPFKSTTARIAKKAYQAAIARAKAAYVAKLNVATKKAGRSGDIEEANRLVAEKKSVESDQIARTETDNSAKLRKKMIGTTWVTGPKTSTRFSKDGKAVKHDGAKIVWTTLHNTLITQSYRSTAIYVWQFDKELHSATITKFVKADRVLTATLRKRRQ